MGTNAREFDSPKKSRKRKLDPSQWKKNINKKRRNMGLSYESMGNKHKQKQARKMKPTCKETCRLKSTSKISHDQREHIFESYWKMGNIDLQRQYIVNCIKEVKPTYQCIREERKRPLYKGKQYLVGIHFQLMALKLEKQNIFTQYS